jgi:uncharacterized protein YjdB
MGQKTQNKGGDTVHVASVSLDQATRKILYGDSYKLTATILPSNAADKSLAWESSDDTVATVTSEGLVTAVAAGSAAISVKTADGNKTDSCSVTVPAGSVEVSVQ